MSLKPLFLLRDGVTFLNHGSFGACPRSVFKAYQSLQRELEDQPVAFLERLHPELMAEARAALGAYVGTTADNLVFVPNASTAVNTIIRSLPLQPGDEILSTAFEYGALERAWEDECSRVGARFVRMPISLPVVDEHQVVDEVWSGRSDRTRVLFISHISSSTAIRLPVEQLIQRARRDGVITVIDGAHAPGQIPLSLDGLDPDFYTGNPHKWMMAPKGCAFLYAAPRSQDLVRPLVTSWGDKSRSASRFVQELEWQGTRDPSAFLAIHAAIQFMEEHDWSAVRARCHELVRTFRIDSANLTGLAPLTPDNPRWFSQMAAVPLPPCDGKRLQRLLLDEYQIEVQVTEHGTRQYLRISVQGYNDREDLQYLLKALPRVLNRTARS